jgi:periplasmic copper chaperone A
VKRLILASLLLSSCGQSGSPNVEIANAWARETVAGQTSTAAYLTVANKGAADDRLVSVSVPEPAKASVHATENSGGISHMREISSGLAVPAGSTIELKPGGTHVMITGLQAPLHPGDTLNLRLRFEKTGEKPIDVRVTPATGPENH